MDLTNKNLSFILLSSDKIESMLSILYAKDYQILPIKGFYRGQYENSALAFSDVDNDELRKELIFLLNHFDQECGIIKYKGELLISTNGYGLLKLKDNKIIRLKNLNKRYSNDPTGGSPELDTIMVLVMAWILAPVDVSLTWIRWYREAEEARRRQGSRFL
jgi:hypothetical protein